MKERLIFLFFLATSITYSQVKPEVLPEDFTPDGGATCFFCKPGVRNKSRSRGLDLAYTFMGRGEFQDEESGIQPPFSEFNQWVRFEADLKFPVMNKEHFRLLLGYKYGFEQFNFTQIGVNFPETFEELDRTTLRSNNISAIVSRPLNETKYLAFRFRYTANGNYDSFFTFDSKYAIYKALALFGIKKHEDFEWGIGLNISKSFRRTNIVPFILFNRTFVNNWGIEAAFPGYIFARYNFSPNTIMLVGTEFSSDSYRMLVDLQDDSVLDYALNHSELLGLARLEQQIIPWIWGNLRAGYQMNFSTDFESKSLDTPAFMVDPTGGFFFEIGVFISPPDHFGK